jgi:hypothetical protein
MAGILISGVLRVIEIALDNSCRRHGYRYHDYGCGMVRQRMSDRIDS